MNNYKINGKEMKLVYDNEAFDAQVNITSPEKGLEYVEVSLKAKSGPALPKLAIEWSVDDIDIQGQWHPQARDTKHLMPPWAPSHHATIASNAPVFCLYNIKGQNRITFALSDCLVPSEVFCSMQESAHSYLSLAARTKPEELMTVENYSITLRVDTREKNFARSLEDVVYWWESIGYTARPVSSDAREPLYSSWYAFHKEDLNTEDLLVEAKLASEIGCKVLLMDDGWCSDEEAGSKEYNTGDFMPVKIPDIRMLSDKLHEMGLKFMIWFATPFITPQSQAWKKFYDMVFESGNNLHNMDFRYPEIREHVASHIENAMRNWNMDGFKIDFIDSIKVNGKELHPGDPRRDTQSVSESIKLFFDDLLERLEKQNKDVLIEFRQAYIGPMMRKYSTMFRGFDCPQDSLNNRILTTDIRLLSGKSMAHSDMFIWSLDEKVEIAALQIANVIFAVPQVSVRISVLPEDHKKMLAFYIKFWTENRELLLDGEFVPLNPEANYPAITSTDEKGFFAALYNPILLTLPDRERLTLLNATPQTNIAVEIPAGHKYKTMIRDCMGNVVKEEILSSGGLTGLNIPLCGVWTAEKID